jgi:surface antigen
MRGGLGCPALGRLSAAAAVLTIALASGGCSLSYQLNSMFESSSDKTASETTGTVVEQGKPSASSPESDTALRAAARRLLARNEAGDSLPWENPLTGARGTVTPIATAYSQAGRTCRDFLASYIREGSESWLQGEACRADEGEWEVRSLKPWTRS